MSSRYELVERDKHAAGATVEWSYDNATEAIEQGRRNAESNPGTVWEVWTAFDSAPNIAEVVWSSSRD